MNNGIKLWRVYKSKIGMWEAQYNTVECFVLAKTWQRAKGIAKAEHPYMFEGIPKSEILVEEVDMNEEKVLN